MKKDQYHLNGNMIQQAELRGILEAAGFSQSNPYYIIEQGSIIKLSQMDPKARLGLLKEIGGSQARLLVIACLPYHAFPTCSFKLL